LLVVAALFSRPEAAAPTSMTAASAVLSGMTMVLVAIRTGTLIGTRRAYERGGLGYWLSPFADLLAWFVVVRGTFFPSREWRGRTY
jgi:hypothetical protein